MKQTAVFLAVCLCVFALFGCSCQSGPQTSGTTTTTTAATTGTTVSVITAQTSLSPTAASDPAGEPTASEDIALLYENHLYGYRLVLPSYWLGRYDVSENGNSTAFYEKSNHEKNGHGKLFSVLIVPSSEYSEGMFPSYQKLGEQDSFVAVMLLPTDVQYDTADAGATESYQLLAGDLPAIAQTFAFV